MEREAKRLQREISKYERGRGRRYPVELRARVASLEGERRADGASWIAMAAELGLGLDKVRRWCAEQKPGTRALVPVTVVADRGHEGRVSIVSPAGYRVDGLLLKEAVELLRVLG